MFNGANTGVYTLRKLYCHFLSHWMGYDSGDRFPFDSEPNGIPFDSESKEKYVTVQSCSF